MCTFILCSKKCSKLESFFRKNRNSSNSDLFKANLKEQAKKGAKLITAERRLYFRSLISDYSKQPKKLWSALDSLLSRKASSCLPSSDSPAQPAALHFCDSLVTKLLNSALSEFPAASVSALVLLELTVCCFWCDWSFYSFDQTCY